MSMEWLNLCSISSNTNFSDKQTTPWSSVTSWPKTNLWTVSLSWASARHKRTSSQEGANNAGGPRPPRDCEWPFTPPVPDEDLATRPRNCVILPINVSQLAFNKWLPNSSRASENSQKAFQAALTSATRMPASAFNLGSTPGAASACLTVLSRRNRACFLKPPFSLRPYLSPCSINLTPKSSWSPAQLANLQCSSRGSWNATAKLRASATSARPPLPSSSLAKSESRVAAPSLPVASTKAGSKCCVQALRSPASAPAMMAAAAVHASDCTKPPRCRASNAAAARA
mmetsp:Transcript_113178/g.292785  ORF Transcript_113178/g.292785 Transcript_113178/m.292785 type:complete len:285 (-) Transcript_113178:723-1577(-)